jgi:hypothetical protein
MEGWILVAVVVAIAAMYWRGIREERRALANRFAERPALDFNAFYQNYYAGKVDRAMTEELLQHVSQELSIPVAKLRPSDRFDAELRPIRGWEFDSGKGILLVEMEKLARAKSKDIDVTSIKTLDDYLLAMAELC